MIHHLLNILPSYPLEYPGFVFLVWQSLQICSCLIIPGNFTLLNSFPVRSFIYLRLAIPSTSCLDFQSWSLSISRDLIMLFVALVCIFSSFKQSSTADFLDFKVTPLERLLKLVLTKLLRVRHDQCMVEETMHIIINTLIELFMAFLCVRNSRLNKHRFSPQMRVMVYYMRAAVFRVHRKLEIIKLLI